MCKMRCRRTYVLNKRPLKEIVSLKMDALGKKVIEILSYFAGRISIKRE